MKPDSDSSGNSTSCAPSAAARAVQRSILSRLHGASPGLVPTATAATRNSSSMLTINLVLEPELVPARVQRALATTGSFGYA